ncbi:hypothetical protein AC477_03930 [miscellaneous Crenarchaeota group-1 archaeon SG8-32-1]|uniref:Uncharacterized protein n=1 Tax=miscellaneous Crenarchaeota group-1 archaeon SG8-32-1 TaxID=1685124 RepID=A0A0M0BSW8_9ARCH|nr:MAG: hypothetical protein AC477_03930 [miscellaneous Crenarchaeota group-1 archaeon SG8-32-1]
MPTISIDTFFACTLILIVVFVSMAATASVAAPHIRGFQDLNEEAYLRKIAEYTVTSPGSPTNWGQIQSSSPDVFGLAKENSFSYDLDVDKVSRLSNQSIYALTYLELLTALRLEKVALSYSITQIMDITILMTSNVTVGDSTTYNFNVTVSRDQTPLATNLQCYVVARDFFNSTTSNTAIDGKGIVQTSIPNNSNGPVLLIVFARNPYDSRLTAQGSYIFAHLSLEPQPNNTFVNLSPLNNTLTITPNISDINLESGNVFTYGYESTLLPTSNSSYIVPEFLDSSPQVLAVTGWNGSDFFIEWATYPQVPLALGADFKFAETFSFKYLVTIDEVFYQLNVKCGGPSL